MDEPPEWTFTFAEETYWAAVRNPPADRNLLDAVEVMSVSFHRSVRRAKEVLAAWRCTEGGGEGAGFGLPSVTLRRRRDGMASIVDRYNQFDSVTIPAVELDLILEKLVDVIALRFPEEREVAS